MAVVVSLAVGYLFDIVLLSLFGTLVGPVVPLLWLMFRDRSGTPEQRGPLFTSQGLRPSSNRDRCIAWGDVAAIGWDARRSRPHAPKFARMLAVMSDGRRIPIGWRARYDPAGAEVRDLNDDVKRALKRVGLSTAHVAVLAADGSVQWPPAPRTMTPDQITHLR